MTARILITGATGNVGRAVVESLQRRGIQVRAAGSDRERVRVTLGPDMDAAALDFWNPATFQPALADCDGLFLMRPPAISQVRRTLLPFVDAARTAGVRHVVFLSVQGADRNRLIPHHAVEQHLKSSTTSFTLLRPGFFAQNLGDAYRRDIVEDHRLYVPAGEGRVAFVDTRDIAEVAAMCLVDPDTHRGAAYTLTGPAPVSFRDAAQLLSDALERPIRYQPASVLGYARHLHRRGAPLPQVAVLCALHVGLRLGQAAQVDPALARLLGNPGRSLFDYIRDHASLWRIETPSGRGHQK